MITPNMVSVKAMKDVVAISDHNTQVVVDTHYLGLDGLGSSKDFNLTRIASELDRQILGTIYDSCLNNKENITHDVEDLKDFGIVDNGDYWISNDFRTTWDYR